MVDLKPALRALFREGEFEQIEAILGALPAAERTTAYWWLPPFLGHYLAARHPTKDVISWGESYNSDNGKGAWAELIREAAKEGKLRSAVDHLERALLHYQALLDNAAKSGKKAATAPQKEKKSKG